MSKANTLALIRRAELALKTGETQGAVRITQSVLRNDPSHIGALEILARAVWQAGRYDLVLTTTEKLLAVNPYEPGYHDLRGAALQCLGRCGEAVAEFSKGSGASEFREAIRDLENWQIQLIGELLHSDPVFRAHYAQNPAQACADRGFGFSPDAAAPNRWIAHGGDRAALYARPS